MNIPKPRKTEDGRIVCEVATTTYDLPSNTLPPLPRPPPTQASKRAQAEKAKYARTKGRASIKNTIAEIAAWEAETRKAAKAEGVNSDTNNNSSTNNTNNNSNPKCADKVVIPF